MKKYIPIVILLLLTLVPLSAQDKQFYFVGQYNRLGSLSSDASNLNKGIYLRWDIIEGDLPSEIKHLVLMRIDADQNTTLLDVDTNGTMGAADIAQMFTQAGEERRLFEAVSVISKNTGSICSGANIQNIGTKVQVCLQDNYWSFLASRVNFDIARANHRAYLDTSFTDDGSSKHYILLAKDDNNNSLIIGDTEVKLVTKNVLPPKHFAQVLTSGCNDGRYALDDYRVALTWSHGGTKTDFFVNGLMVSGYDLYYSTQSLDHLAAGFENKNIASLAEGRPHNASGDVDLSSFGLKKANDTLITLGAQDVAIDKAIYVEKMETLKERGFKAGEKRYYFLVPRDFTGNYGPTQSLIVTIPDLLPPPMPYNARAIEDGGKSTIVWSSLTLGQYAKHYKDVLKVCGTQTHTKAQRVQFVEHNESCIAGKGLTVNFNIKKYNIYRFDNLQDAASFIDSDLDGYPDSNETTSNIECDAQSFPADIDLKHLVATVPSSTSKFLRFRDTTVKHSKVYWYRIAAITENNISSALTAPIRAFVRNREVLPAPEFTIMHTRYSVAKKENKTSDVRDTVIAFDKSIDTPITEVKLSYKGDKYPLFTTGNHQFELTQEILNIEFGTRQDIVTLKFYVNGVIKFTFRAPIDSCFHLITVLGDDKKTPIGYNINTVHHYSELQSDKIPLIDGGGIVNDCFTLTYGDAYYAAMQARGGHMEISQRIGLKRYAYDRNATPDQNQVICPEQTHRGDLVSLRLIECTPGGVCSQPSFINATLLGTSAPDAPALNTLELDEALQHALIKFTPNLDKVKGTMLYLYKEGDDNNSYTKIIPHIGNKTLNAIDIKIENITQLVQDTTWCVKAKTIGLNGKVSPWSSTVCQELNALPDNNIAWPFIPNNTIKKSDIVAQFNNESIRLRLISSVGSPKECEKFFEILQKLSTFVIYRQTVDMDTNATTKFVQVSPLIDNLGSCEKSSRPEESLFREMSNNLFFDRQGESSDLKFIDLYPYVVGESYRYVILYFDDVSKEISSYALSNIVSTQ